ncbi:MAG TPA: DUF1501 domain-containing protein [Vicinamibacterales bacterium]|nr:DUF1501 domain-containing protein [Vicinamibacterales bacterium]
MNINRRKFLNQTAGLTASAMAGTLGGLGIEAAKAQSVPNYQALVAVFLFGGSDSNNMVIPYTNYANYAATRTAASNVAIAQNQLLQIAAPTQGTATFGLHPSFTQLQTVYNAKKMAILANVGTLIAPLTKAQYQAGQNRPLNLFSHSDQQDAFEGLIPLAQTQTGWGGRMADKLISVNNGAKVPTVISLQGSQVFNNGNNTVALSIPTNGGVAISGQATDAVSTARFNALNSLLNTGSSDVIVQSSADVMKLALAADAAVNPVVATTSTFITNAFGNLNTNIAQQLKQVARMIDGRAALGVTRQVFFVGVGGYDTHTTTVQTQTTLFNQLVPALAAFYNYTVAAGVANSVTTFTMSDFNRTFIGNGNAGVDHAWGGHALIIGGAVKGGDIYGKFPDLTVKGPDDSGSNGAWVPTTSMDEMGATLGRWFGLAQSDLNYMFPNLSKMNNPTGLTFL